MHTHNIITWWRRERFRDALVASWTANRANLSAYDELGGVDTTVANEFYLETRPRSGSGAEDEQLIVVRVAEEQRRIRD